MTIILKGMTMSTTVAIAMAVRHDCRTYLIRYADGMSRRVLASSTEAARSFGYTSYPGQAIVDVAPAGEGV
ncbi:hypothetical protein [Agromyces sp. NPDC058104]|uniref:hypothetical protein n=1 Tax=Agromyces sp. NPDC058104 TaxID=3346342 RepID=UPI0036DBF062